jgi:hypothetical protein
MTRRSGSWYGSGLSRTPRTIVKIAVFAPMPRVRATIARSVKAGLRANVRAA